MALERALKRLNLDPSTLCRQCRRTFTTTPRSRAGQQQNATAAFAEMMQKNQTRTQTIRSQPPTQSTAAAIPPLPTGTSPSGGAATPSKPDAFTVMSNLTNQIATSARKKKDDESLANLERLASRKDYEMQQHRRFRVGDVYAPHDLSGVEMGKWKKVKTKGRPKRDVMDELGMNPLMHYRNFSIMSEYVTDLGRIKHSKDTGLRPRNQRRMAKAVRRAIGLGLIPSVYKHPELLEEKVARFMPRGSY